MEYLPEFLIAAVTVIVILVGISFLIPHLVKKGINISGILSGTTSALNTADFVVGGLRTLLPETSAFTVVDKVINYAKQAAEAAEQMYKTSVIEAAERKEAATNIVFDCLRMTGLEITDDIKNVVDSCIEAAVFSLPKTEIAQ